MNISLSEIDQQRFGIVTAKAVLENCDQLNEVINWCVEKKTELLIARIPVENITLAQDMEMAGCTLADTLVYYKNSHYHAAPVTTPEGYSWRLAIEADSDEVGRLSERIFRNYQGHYHSDRRLKKSDCDQVYASWAADSCLHKNASDAVLLILFNEKIAGFLTVKSIDSETCEIVLNGVDPDLQNKGIYSMLITLAKMWAAQHQLVQIVVSTQLNNLAVQKVWCRHGFEPYKSFYTFHKWFSS